MHTENKQRQIWSLLWGISDVILISLDNFTRNSVICTILKFAFLFHSLNPSIYLTKIAGEGEREQKRGRKEMFCLMMHSKHFLFMIIRREEIHCCHMGYSFWLAARALLYAPSHRQDNTYHGLCYTSCGTLVECEIAQWVHHEGSIWWPIIPCPDTLPQEREMDRWR